MAWLETSGHRNSQRPAAALAPKQRSNHHPPKRLSRDNSWSTIRSRRPPQCDAHAGSPERAQAPQKGGTLRTRILAGTTGAVLALSLIATPALVRDRHRGGDESKSTSTLFRQDISFLQSASQGRHLRDHRGDDGSPFRLN